MKLKNEARKTVTPATETDLNIRIEQIESEKRTLMMQIKAAENELGILATAGESARNEKRQLALQMQEKLADLELLDIEKQAVAGQLRNLQNVSAKEKLSAQVKRFNESSELREFQKLLQDAEDLRERFTLKLGELETSTRQVAGMRLAIVLQMPISARHPDLIPLTAPEIMATGGTVLGTWITQVKDLFESLHGNLRSHQ